MHNAETPWWSTSQPTISSTPSTHLAFQYACCSSHCYFGRIFPSRNTQMTCSIRWRHFTCLRWRHTRWRQVTWSDRFISAFFRNPPKSSSCFSSTSIIHMNKAHNHQDLQQNLHSVSGKTQIPKLWLVPLCSVVLPQVQRPSRLTLSSLWKQNAFCIVFGKRCMKTRTDPHWRQMQKPYTH